jgi:RimJ/RimL family protein N-acetyltransferase
MRDWNVRMGAAADLFAIERLWHALYEHQKRHGMFLEVSPDSFKDWAESMKVTLGRFTCLVVAEWHGETIGFVAGRLKTLPPYFGGFTVGFISEVFVSETHRKQGLAREMLDLVTQWFSTQRVHRIELQVLVDNSGARQVYRELGWKEELIQMVWELPVKK